MISPSPASSDLVEHISAHSGSLPSARRLVPYFSNFGVLLYVVTRQFRAHAFESMRSKHHNVNRADA